MDCKVCNTGCDYFDEALLLTKHKVKYYICPDCGFIQTEEPYWLEDAYSQAINKQDTGILYRNYNLAKYSSVIIYFLFKHQEKFVDYGGGYGIFTRLMRDYGFDFYWMDNYCENVVAQGFEFNPAKSGNDVEAVTCFEVFEHFINPMEELEKIIGISSNIIFTTELIPDSVPKVNDWYYYGPEHGQHLSFYSLKSLRVIAKKYQLNLYSNHKSLHIMSERKINPLFFKAVLLLAKFGADNFVKLIKKSKTLEDAEIY